MDWLGPITQVLLAAQDPHFYSIFGGLGGLLTIVLIVGFFMGLIGPSRND